MPSLIDLRKNFLGFALVLAICTSFALPSIAALPAGDNASATADADQIVLQTKRQAAAEHKNVLLVFSASWCGPCQMFEAFLKDPATGPIMDKYFVVGRLDVGEHANDKRHANTPGAEQLRASMKGADAGYPFLAMLDPAGKVLVDSCRPVAGHPNNGDNNIGYPATPTEISWFMEMLHRSAPSMSSSEAETVRKWLQQRGR